MEDHLKQFKIDGPAEGAKAEILGGARAKFRAELRLDLFLKILAAAFFALLAVNVAVDWDVISSTARSSSVGSLHGVPRSIEAQIYGVKQ